jgi:hypothetical protein
MFETISRCMDLKGKDIVIAAQSSDSMRALLHRFSQIATPGKGAPIMLAALARLGTTACDWIDGELRIELIADGEHTIVSVASSMGGGFREKLFPDTRIHAGFEEFTRAVSLTPKLIQPLTARETGKRLVLTATSEVRKTSLPPPMITIDSSSLLEDVPKMPAPRKVTLDLIDEPFPPSEGTREKRPSNEPKIVLKRRDRSKG